MNYEKIYFVENFHGIQYFLSLYQWEESNLIVMSKDVSLNTFLEKIMPNEKKITVPRLPFIHLPAPNLFEKQRIQFTIWRKQIGYLLDEVRPPTEAYFFGDAGQYHFFMLLAKLIKNKVSVKYVNAHPEFYKETIDNHPLSTENQNRLFNFQEPIDNKHLTPEYQNHLFNLSEIVGLPLMVYKTLRWTYMGLADCPKSTSCSLESWQKISKKFDITINLDTQDSILLLDCPPENFIKELKVEESRTNIINFFSDIIDKGTKIHLKPHPNLEKTTFSGTHLENKISILPKHFPSELIMHKYPEIYGDFSMSFATPVDGKKYSYANLLLVFKSSEHKNNYWQIFNSLLLLGAGLETKILDNGLIELISQSQTNSSCVHVKRKKELFQMTELAS